MRKYWFTFMVVFLFFSFLGADEIKMNINPNQIFVGTPITFTLVLSNQQVPVSGWSWNFGDGSAPQTTASPTYFYQAPGNYTVFCSYTGGSVTRQVAVKDNRSMRVSPPYLFEGSKAEFVTRNFNTGTLKWDFDDGVVENAGQRHNHIFTRSGVYTVKVYDFDGKSKVPVLEKVKILREDRSIEIKTQVVYQGTEAEIEAKNFKDNSIKWSLGDGFTTIGSRRIKHKYSATGTFTISAVDFGGKDGKEITGRIQVQADSRQLKLPAELIAGEGYDMSVENASGGSLEWQFSNGEVKSGERLRAKAFRSAGPHTVTIVDRSGKYPPLSQQIVVKPDLRSVNASPKSALPNDTINLKAVNFKGPINWDFGDGARKANGAPIEAHKYEKIGNYTISAVDFGGQSQKTFTTQVVVTELTPDFDITHIELVFGNGKYYRLVPQKSTPPSYQVRIKARGRGILRGKWVLDGMTMGLFEVLLEEKKTAVLRGSRVVKLPIIDAGMHNFTLEFTNYEYEKQIPILRYFVTTAGAIDISSPLPDARIENQETLQLEWLLKKRRGFFEIAISEIPFQFLRDNQIEWQKVGIKQHYLLDISNYKKKTWIYWQVREVDSSGRVLTTSEIASFKILQ